MAQVSSPTNPELLDTIRRESRLRLLAVVGLPIGSGILWLATDRPEIFWAGLIIAIIELCLLGLVTTWLRWGRYLVTLDYFALAMDIVAITLGLHFVGGVEFPFDWVYAVSLAAVSIARGLWAGLAFAQWSILCYGVLIWAEYRGLLPHMTLFPIFGRAPLYNDFQYVVTKLISNTAIFNLAALNAAFFSAVLKRKVEERTRELKEAQVQLVHSQKLATLGQIAASLAHGLASPITGIKGAAELLLDDVPSSGSAQRRVTQILHWTDHLSDLLERLRNLARPPQDEKKPTDINKVMRDVVDLTSKLLTQNKIHVDARFAPDLPLALASARQLEELFMNLVLNARDAMPDGGTLTVSTARQDDKIVVRVQDTGIGMSPEVQKRLFEPFFTTKGEHGSGLGLNISRQIVVDHGGRLRVESQEGQGSTFIVELPIVAEKKT